MRLDLCRREEDTLEGVAQSDTLTTLVNHLEMVDDEETDKSASNGLSQNVISVCQIGAATLCNLTPSPQRR